MILNNLKVGKSWEIGSIKIQKVWKNLTGLEMESIGSRNRTEFALSLVT